MVWPAMPYLRHVPQVQALHTEDALRVRGVGGVRAHERAERLPTRVEQHLWREGEAKGQQRSKGQQAMLTD